MLTFRSSEVQLFLLVFVLLLISVLPLSGSNERSRFALTAAMASNRSFAINSYLSFATVDVSNYWGTYHSSLAPGLSVISLHPSPLGPSSSR